MSAPQRVIMSPPDFFDIEYSINPWMNTDNKVHPQHAYKEWQTLRNYYLSAGLDILTIPPVQGLPDLVFTTDHGKWIGDTFYVSRFRYPERAREQLVTLPWYREHHIKLCEIPLDCFMEGGDLHFYNDTIFVGTGFRTSPNTIQFLTSATGLSVANLELIDEAFYHLDTCFLPISSDTAFYYPPAFSKESIKILKAHFDLLLSVTSHEAEGFACNSVIVGKEILCEPNPTFEAKLRELGFIPVIMEMHEFNKSGGGIHCLSQLLD